MKKILKAALLACFCAFVIQGRAQTYVVENLNDLGEGSLRALAALAVSGDTLRFDDALWGDTLYLTTGPLVINQAIHILGPGANQLVINASGISRHFVFNTGAQTAELSGLTLIGGNGGGLGGAVRNLGSLRISGCAFFQNNADRGGAVLNSGNVVIERCSFVGNSANLQGGGVLSGTGSMEIDRCTISGNSAGVGAGVYITSGTGRIYATTLVHNSALLQAGGIFNDGDLSVGSTLIALNNAPVDAQFFSSGALSSEGYNLLSEQGSLPLDSLDFGLVGSDDAIINPFLDSLFYPGNGLPVHPLKCGSPAVDAGNPLDLQPDQSGVPVFGPSRDIGASELAIEGLVLSCPSDTLLTGTCDGALINYQAPLSPDCPSASLSLLEGLPSGALFPPGTSTVSYALQVSESSPVQQCSFTVQVLDEEDPVFLASGGDYLQVNATQGAQILSGDQLGFSVSISGNYAVGGAPGNDVRNFNAGAVVVYRLEEDEWLRDTLLTASDGTFNESLGIATALHGNQLLAGAYKETRLGFFEAGAVYAYKRNESGLWQQTQKILSPTATPYDWLGYAVAMSGELACMSAPRDDQKGFDAGAVFTLRYDGTTWVGAEKIIAPDGNSGDWFGRSVAIDGNLMLVGAHLYGEDDRGRAYLFRYNDSVWVYEAALSPADLQAGDSFGWSVALDDGRALVGAFLSDPDGKTNAGAAYVFVQDSSGQWVQQQKLVPSLAAPGDFIGVSVALSGHQALLGANGADLDGSASGTAFHYTFSEGVWVEREPLRGSAVAGQQNGWSVAMEGSRAVLGAPFASLDGQPGGLLRFFGESSVCNSVFELPTDPNTCGRLFNYPLPVAEDDCGLSSFGLISGLGSGAVFPLGESVEIYRAQDSSGRESTCQVSVRVLDTEAPTALCDSLELILPTDDILQIDALQLDGGSYDACPGALSFDIDSAAALFSCLDLGQTRMVELLVTDSAGNSASCLAAVSLINPYDELSLNLLSLVQPSAIGASDGQINISASGGLPPYSYFWSTGDTLPSISGLPQGSYSVTVYDAHCQSASQNIVLSDPIPTCSPSSAPANPRHQLISNGVLMLWDPVPLSVGCRVKARRIGAPGGFSTLPPVLGPEPGSIFVHKNNLIPGNSYTWRVQCACSLSPEIATPFTALDTFFVPLAREGWGEAVLNLWPVPARDHLSWSLTGAEAGLARVRVLDINGREHNISYVMLSGTQHTEELGIQELAEGFYLLEIVQDQQRWQKAFVRAKD